ANQKIIASGNAHSEVMSDQSMKEQSPADKAKEDAAKAESKKQAEAALKAASKPDSTTDSPSDSPDETAPPDGTEPVKKAAAPPPKASKAPPEKIITDADNQEYDRATGRFAATGHVRVKHGDITVKANKLNLVYGVDGKPETAVFTGNVSATQNKNNTIADNMTYFLNTQRLQATGHVRSKVIQEKPPDAGKKGGPITSQEKASDKDPKVAANGGPALIAFNGLESKDPIYITSDAQDYSKDTGLLNAEGNVRVYYGETLGLGPKVVMIRDSEGRAEKVVFTGRSQISQPGKRWIGDRITMLVDDHRVLAEGNTKAFLLSMPKKPEKSATPTTQVAGAKGAVTQ
ncbi:MAG TPA: LptA/OstA family protein, partial [Chroococcales cyanobacterium]